MNKGLEAAISVPDSPDETGLMVDRPLVDRVERRPPLRLERSGSGPRLVPSGPTVVPGDHHRLSVEVVTQRHGLDRHQVAWNHLLSVSPEGDVFQSYEWLSSWLDAFWRDKPLSFFFVWEGDALRAVAPLVQDRESTMCCGAGLALPVNSHGACNILHDGDPESVLRAIIEHLRFEGAPVRMNLGYIRSDSDTVVALRRLIPEYGLWSFSRDKGAWPIARLSKTWDDYLDSRSPRVRHELRRKEARARREANVAFRVITDEPSLADTMEHIVGIEERSWKAPEGLTITAVEESRSFYATLTRRAARGGRLRIYLLYIDGEPVGHICGLTTNGEFQALTTSYDQAYARFSPGALMFGYALRDAFASGVEVFDFLSGESRWKNELATGHREYQDLCVFSQPSVPCSLRWMQDGHVKPFFRKHLPSFVAAKNRMRPRKR